MRKIILYMGLMCLFAGWCTSCSNDSEEGIGGDTPILLTAQATDGLQTRSTITDNQPLLQNMEAGVYINEDGGANAPIGANLHYKKVNASGGLDLQGGSQPYYPSSGRGVKISAYYPYNSGTASSFDFSIKANQSTDAGYNASDLLYSAETSYTRQSTAHSLPFKHKLSRITYILIAGNNVPSLTGATVSIVNVLTTTEFNRTTGTVGLAKGTSTTIVPNASGAIVVPQTIASGVRLIKVSAGGNDYYYKPSSALVLESGKSYDFEIRVEGTELQVGYTVTDWTNGTVADNGGTITACSYRVGDYYPDPNVDLSNPVEKAKIKGLIFWLDPASGGKHGKVVGLEENSGVAWAYSAGITSATNMANGRANMRAIYTISTTFSVYPAFAWVHSFNDANEDYNDANATGVWYLPAKDELKALYAGYSGKVYETISGWSDFNSMPGYNDPSAQAARSAFNDRLTDANGTTLGNYYYWSSSEYDGSVEFVAFDNGYTGNYYNRSSLNRVRCVLAF